MLTSRHRAVPSLPSTKALAATYAARLDAVADLPSARRGGVWTGLLSAGLGLGIGVLSMLLFTATPPPPSILTPQQQTLLALVHDLAQTSTPDQAWVIMTRLDKMVRSMHPQPRPRPEGLLPTRREP